MQYQESKDLSTEHSNLSYRQKQCLHYLSRGMTMKQIAQILNISPRTVEHHIDSIKTKFKCYTRADLISKINSRCFWNDEESRLYPLIYLGFCHRN